MEKDKEESEYSQMDRYSETDITEQKLTEKELKEYRNHLEEMIEERTAKLEKYNEQLQREIKERKRAEKEILEYQERLRALTHKLSKTEEQERRRLAKKFHDDVGQILLLSRIMLGEVQESVSSNGLTEKVGKIRELNEQMIESTRSLTSELSPIILYELGFNAAVEELIEQIQKSTDIGFDFEHDGKDKPMDEEIGIILFKAVRELLVNIVRHSEANKAKVSIKRTDDKIQIRVEDDGIGFDVSKIDSYSGVNKRFGLFNIREQVDNIDGHFELKSEPDQGTQVTLVAPIKEKDTKGE